MSIRPYRRAVSAYISCTLLASLTSAAKKNASRHSDAVFSPASRPTSATQTRAPSAEKSSAASRPIPPAAPVMTATFRRDVPSASFEEPLAFVVRDDLVEQRLLGARVVQVMVDHVVAERLARHRPALQQPDGLAQGAREALDVGLVGVAFELRRKFELLLHAMQPGREQCREAQVRVGVSAGDARLGPQVLAVADDAKAARAVVVAPRESRRRPAPGGEALVGVDVGRQENRQLRRICDVARQVLL